MYSGPVVLTDSRGRYLQEVLDSLVGYGPLVCFRPGATINSMYSEILELSTHLQVSALYILVGVNDTTWRDKKLKRTFAPYFTADELCGDITEKIVYLIHYALNDCRIPKVIFLPIVGLDLARYNKDLGENPWQHVIDEGVKMVNTNIISLNAAFGHSTPMIHQSIYKSKGHGKTKTFYGRLWDGLHPRGDILERWGEGILKAMWLNWDF